MPTGYTASLYEGKEVSFRDFVLGCSRAMGATVLLRDYSLDVLPTPENVIESDRYEKRLAEAREELTRWQSMSDEDVLTETAQYNNERLGSYAEAVAKDTRMLNAYTNMLEQVRAWKPPTKDHTGLKEFMIEQLEGSIKHDCGVNAEWYSTRTPQEHQATQIASLARQVVRLEEDARKARERNEERVEWVRALYESLPKEE